MAGSGYRTDASARLGERAIVGFSRPSCWASGGSRAIGSERSHVPAQRRRRIASPAAFIDRRIVSATASACAADRYVSCSRIAPAMIRTRSSRVRGGGEPALGIPHGSAIGTKCEADVEPTAIISNTFRVEWPPRSGRKAEFPEIDRAD